MRTVTELHKNLSHLHVEQAKELKGQAFVLVVLKSQYV